MYILGYTRQCSMYITVYWTKSLNLQIIWPPLGPGEPPSPVYVLAAIPATLPATATWYVWSQSIQVGVQKPLTNDKVYPNGSWMESSYMVWHHVVGNSVSGLCGRVALGESFGINQVGDSSGDTTICTPYQLVPRISLSFVPAWWSQLCWKSSPALSPQNHCIQVICRYILMVIIGNW